MADPRPLTSSEDLLCRYAAGERDFAGANLEGANLEGANLEGANLEGAIFRDANLRDANLCNVTLESASLEGTTLSGAYLINAYLAGTKLSKADLSGAVLTRADLSLASLLAANLLGADIRGAILLGTRLRGADLRAVRLGGTHMIEIDLSPFCEARSTAIHTGPCFIDHSSILHSVHAPGLTEFLSKAGLPEVFAVYMVDCARSLKSEVFKMLQSTFISYGFPDEAFAKKLNDALFRNGVTTFFFKDHALPGKKLHRLMRDGVNKHDRVLLVCSEASLTRAGVLNEIEETLAREANDGGAEYLLPIRLDDHIFGDKFAEACNKLDKGDFVAALRRRVIGDFRDADKDDAKFTSELLKVIAALKK